MYCRLICFVLLVQFGNSLGSDLSLIINNLKKPHLFLTLPAHHSSRTTPGYFSVFTTPLPSEQVILEDLKTNALPNRTVCGLERETPKIVGGTITALGEFPWMAALEYKSKISGEHAGLRCGGSLINNRYVLTSAHCLIDREFQLISVRLGEWNITSDPDCIYSECSSVLKVNIDELIPHPFYSRKTKNNDIGLVRLERIVEYTDYIRPICLPSINLPNPPFGTEFTVVGWGATENGTFSDVKLKVNVPLFNTEECYKKLRRSEPITPNMLCAGGEYGKDSCVGDGGSPLMRIHWHPKIVQSQWYQEGVVSWGVGCARPGYPAIYTRVSRYIPWILQNISEDL